MATVLAFERNIGPFCATTNTLLNNDPVNEDPNNRPNILSASLLLRKYTLVNFSQNLIVTLASPIGQPEFAPPE